VLIRVLVFAVGFALTAWTVASAVRTVILPRSAQSVLSRVVFRSLRVVFRTVAGPNRSFSWRDRVMAYFGPVGLLTLVAVWLALVTFAFTLMFWAVEQQGWSVAYHESWSSLLTLGFAGVDGAGARTLAFIEAALGLALLALLITYLPTLYGAFSRRESLVALLEVRAGTPPSAVGMLERFHRIGWTDRLSDLWTDWERWFAEVEESHTSYPVLTFFRSPQPDRHWVTAAGTVLDAAALSMAVLDIDRQPQAALAVRAGFISLRRIADTFGIEYDADPAPGDPISITRDEFAAVVERLASQGVGLVADRGQAWRDFSGWRVNYDTVLLDLAELTMAPYAPWTSDRSAPRHRRPRVRRWGRPDRGLRLEP
jgi:hypothetical protein